MDLLLFYQKNDIILLGDNMRKTKKIKLKIKKKNFIILLVIVFLTILSINKVSNLVIN